MNRWSVYGAMTETLPNQTEFDSLLGQVARIYQMRSIYLTKYKRNRNKSDSFEDLLWDLRLEESKRWSGRQNIRQPIFWATQKEIRGKLEGTQKGASLQLFIFWRLEKAYHLHPQK